MIASTIDAQVLRDKATRRVSVIQTSIVLSYDRVGSAWRVMS
jgi:hypothetical protein